MDDQRKKRKYQRAGYDRRKAYKLGYFINGGVERRRGRDRRTED
jgi:hypothetical protein